MTTTTQNNEKAALTVHQLEMRDYFSAKAMQGLIATRHPHHQGSDGPDQLSADAYLIADAMVAARSK